MQWDHYQSCWLIYQFICVVWDWGVSFCSIYFWTTLSTDCQHLADQSYKMQKLIIYHFVEDSNVAITCKKKMGILIRYNKYLHLCLDTFIICTNKKGGSNHVCNGKSDKGHSLPFHLWMSQNEKHAITSVKWKRFFLAEHQLLFRNKLSGEHCPLSYMECSSMKINFYCWIHKTILTIYIS